MTCTLTLVGLLLATEAQPTQPAPGPAAEQLPMPLASGPTPQTFRPECWRRPPPLETYPPYMRDRYGYLRPRIIAGPYGMSFYAATGEPYWFLPVRTAP